eukprot:CAMPEP_0196679268 /NCGR_PEP_ID=MMETSP1090-20130531/6952_1 /TAXON_ID=37098 /ORGANISM="Isochrysis sp, Strain CCMP1244" /LENGTH=296 /DNA_ID=CAMNT_0042017489 /DNA_START=27 /DNA_END=917 /DNA_ORIENTATION=-
MSLLRALLIAAAAATSGARTVVPQPAALTRLQRLRGGNALVATPPDGFEGAVAAGSKKAAMPADKVFRLGVFSGVHIGFGALLMLTVGGACPGLAESNPGLHKLVLGAFGLPFGLMMTLLSGAELFTGNTALVTMALIEGKATTAGLVKSWVSSYAGNLAGSLLLAGLVSAAGVLAGGGAAAAKVAVAKTSGAFLPTLLKGVLCNWLVCMAVYLASFAKDAAGKMVIIWFIISSFVAMGLEHSVANMFLIPLGILSGADVSWKAFLLKNLLPVTLGNIVGGAVCVGAAFCSVFGSA